MGIQMANEKTALHITSYDTACDQSIFLFDKKPKVNTQKCLPIFTTPRQKVTEFTNIHAKSQEPSSAGATYMSSVIYPTKSTKMKRNSEMENL